MIETTEDKQAVKPDKVKALADYIVAECKKQGFTIEDFESLNGYLDIALGDRKLKTYKELF